MPTLVQKLLPVNFFSEQGDLCAPASLAMVLDYLGTPDILTIPGILNTLFYSVGTWINPASFGAAGGPVGVTCTLNRYAPQQRIARSISYRLLATELPYEANDSMVRALFQNNTPSLALVQHGSHWVVVTGAQTTSDPADDARYELRALWIQDPANYDIEHITYEAWLYTRFTGSVAFHPRQFVCVTDGTFAARPMALLPPPERPHADIETAASDDSVVECAREGLAQYGLASRIAGCSPKPPLGVTYGSNSDGEKGYNLVEFVSPELPTKTVVRVDAFNGTYFGAQFNVPKDAPLYRSPAEVYALADEALAALPPDEQTWRGSIDTNVPPQLLWSESQQSASPYKPFYVVTTKNASQLYVRSDGNVFLNLAFV